MANHNWLPPKWLINILIRAISPHLWEKKECNFMFCQPNPSLPHNQNGKNRSQLQNGIILILWVYKTVETADAVGTSIIMLDSY